jgi:2-polyprenyl-6-methoxyphenol hydroxylase-like FAD-dependent oxidoreductase
MNEKLAVHSNRVQEAAFGHAVVIGSSMAGLTAARVLTDYISRVTIIDRDRLPDVPQFRQGVPQARHAHTLPLRGQQILEQEFPGITDELIANGATSLDGSSETALFMDGSWQSLRNPGAVVSMTYSRPLLETVLYHRLADHPQVQVIQEPEVLGLSVDQRGEQVRGARLRSRHEPDETELVADLVVDASGRDSRAPEWLADLGYAPPQESTVDALPGYASRIYRRPAGFERRWKTLYVRPTPPNNTRGGAIIPIEDNRWYVSLMGMAGDYPPTDEEGFMAYARSLPTPDLYEAHQRG